MTKAIEETWAMHPECTQIVTAGGDCVWASEGYDGDAERMKLAACGPEMARMLLALEWDEPGDGGICRVCSGRKWTDGLPKEHEPDCAWLALMRKAGVR